MVGKYPGEEIKLIEGSTIKDFICDGCGTPLPKGTAVHAMSLYTARTPYFPWEDDFIAREPAFHGLRPLLKRAKDKDKDNGAKEG